jgi:hypothetical protein
MAQPVVRYRLHVKIHTSGARVRALANLLIGYNADTSPIDFSLWPEIGQMLDEIGAEIISTANEVETTYMQAKTSRKRKRA